MKNRFSFLTFVLISLLTIISCSKELQAIIIDGGDFSLEIGEKKELTIKTEPEGFVLGNILYASSSPAIAKVSNTGEVTAIKGGTTKITVAAAGKTTSCMVTVLDDSEAMKIVGGDITMGVGKTRQLTLSPSDLNSQSVEYFSNDTNVVTVTNSGLVTAIGEGSTTITATVDGESCSITVTVTATPELNFVNPISKIEVGTTATLTVSVKPANLSYSFSSSDPNVLSVSQDGMLEAKKTGTASISVINGDYGISKSVQIEVVNQFSPSTIRQGGLLFNRVAYEDFEDANLNGTTAGDGIKIENHQFNYLTSIKGDRTFTLNCTQAYDFVRIRYKTNCNATPFLILLTSGADIVYLRENGGQIHTRIFDEATWTKQSALIPFTNYNASSKNQFVNFDIYRRDESNVTVFVDDVAYDLNFSNFTSNTFGDNPVFKFNVDVAYSGQNYSQIEYVACYKGPTLNSNNFSIIPEPVSINMNYGEFTINSDTKIVDNSGIDISKQIGIFKNQIAASSGITLSSGSGDTNVIKLVRTTQNKNKEWYQLVVTQEAITITAKERAGFFYAMQTLLQMLPPEVYSKTAKNYSLAISCATIEDEPRFVHRGLHTDVSRHFFPISTLKKIIDEIAKTKINIFHWHLTDDGGFRFPFEGTVTVGSKVYDLAAFVQGTSWRTGTTPENSNFQFSWNFFNPNNPLDPWYAYKDNMHGGHYTREEIIDFINYCDDRCITVIPEIDLPGHSRPLHIFFEDLRCDKVNTNNKDKNVTNDVCASSVATLPILKELIRQMCEVFPSEIFNIGGDEVHINNNSWYDLGPWWFCSRCAGKIKEVVGPSAAVNYANLQKLQAWITKELEQAVIANGKRAAIWNEAMRGEFNADSSTVLWYWNGANDLKRAKNQGLDIVNCDTWEYYIDYYQHQSDRNQKNPDAQDWGGSAPTISLQSVYNNDPTKEHSGIQFGSKQLGVQVNMWCEKIIGFTKNGKTYSKDDHLIYMIFPRVFSLAERAWSPESKKNWTKFENKMQTHFKRLDNAGIDSYATHYKK